MDFKTLVGGGAVFAGIAAFWKTFKNIISRIYNIFIFEGTLGFSIKENILTYLLNNKNYKRYKLLPRYFESNYRYTRTGHKFVCEERMVNNKLHIFYQKGIIKRFFPIVLTTQKKSEDVSSDNNDTYKIFFIRGTLNIDKFLADANKFVDTFIGSSTYRRFLISLLSGSLSKGLSSDKEEKRIEQEIIKYDDNVYGIEMALRKKLKRIIGFKHEELYINKNKKQTADHLVLPPESQNLINEIKTWKKSKNWYKKRNIIWKRSVLLHGRQGTGKSCLARVIAEILDLPLFVTDLPTMRNNDLQKAWQEVLLNQPAIILIEDIDVAFDKRVNNHKSQFVQKLSFDFFLNVLDGSIIPNQNGIFVIMTTNHIDKIDRALGIDENGISSRPGRIDRIIKLKEMTESDRYKLAKKILPDYNDMEALVAEGDGDTVAQFQERCVRIALKDFWDKKNNIIKEVKYG